MIGATTELTGDERDFLESTVDTLAADVFIDGLGRDHFLDLDRNEETEADWREFMQRAGAADLLGIAIPEEYNGAGGTYMETVLAEQALGYVGCIQHACQVSIGQHAGGMLHAHGNDHLKEAYLKPLLAGDRVIAQAFTEPTVGTDLPHLQTRATQDGDEWVIDGEKRFIDFAGYADFMIVPARTSGDDGDRDGISFFIVDMDADGYTVLDRQSEGWHGFRGTDACWIGLDDVRVPAANLLGEAGEAWDYLTEELNLEHYNIARYNLGAAERAFEIAVNYTMHRDVNEKPVSRYQAINHLVAECATRLDAAYLLNTRGARLLDDSGMAAGRMESAMAKWFGNEVAHQVADTAMQIMGGIAIGDKYPVERTQRDVRQGRYTGGTTQVMKSVTQHHVYEQLADPSFRGELVGHEREGLPWVREDSPVTAADD